MIKLVEHFGDTMLVCRLGFCTVIAFCDEDNAVQVRFNRKRPVDVCKLDIARSAALELQQKAAAIRDGMKWTGGIE